MNSDKPHPDPLPLDAYLDGTLPEAERARVAKEIAARPQLQRAVELQKRIDGSLRQSMAPPVVPPDLLARLQEATAPQPAANAQKSKPSRLKLVLAGSAVAIVWGILCWRMFFSSDHRSTAQAYPPVPLATVYKDAVDHGFQPNWVCKDDHQFASTFFERQGQGLLLAAMPEGTKMEGLAYTRGLTPQATTMLARVDGKPVMVFVDKAGCGSEPSDPAPETGLHLFRKELGSLVLYELTPLDHAAVMQYLYAADVPPEKTGPASEK